MVRNLQVCRVDVSGAVQAARFRAQQLGGDEGVDVALVDPFAVTNHSVRGIVVLLFEPVMHTETTILSPTQHPLTTAVTGFPVTLTNLLKPFEAAAERFPKKGDDGPWSQRA